MNYLLLTLNLFVAATAYSAEETYFSSEQIAQANVIFAEQEIKATMLVAAHDGKLAYVHNAARSKKAYSPASTFKVINTLIALDAGAVESEQSEFKWDGVERSVDAWNQDQTLGTAFRVSCVWCYQQMARQIGPVTYRDKLSESRYGNQKIGNQVDLFWLDDSLKISAREQIDFLQKLTSYSLSFSDKHVDILKSIMQAEATHTYTVYGKTGWTGPELAVGWYVGFVEREETTWLFAMNMHLEDGKKAHLRKELTFKALEALRLLE